MYYFSFLNAEVFGARSAQPYLSGKCLAKPGSRNIAALPAQHTPAASSQMLVCALQQLISICMGHIHCQHQGSCKNLDHIFHHFYSQTVCMFEPFFLSMVTPYPKSDGDARMEHSDPTAGLWSVCQVRNSLPPTRVYFFLHRDNSGLDCFVCLCAATELLSHVCFPAWVEIISVPLPTP